MLWVTVSILSLIPDIAFADSIQGFVPGIIVIAAIVDSINPCAFSVLLLTIGFLVSLKSTPKKILLVGLIYVSGIFISYLLIGLGILNALKLFDIPHFMSKIGALIVISLGIISILGHYFPSFPIKLKIPQVAHSKIAKLIHNSTLPAALLLGGLVGLAEFPCTGGPYLMILGLLYDSTTYLKGVIYLVIYNLIFVAPLILLVVISSNKKVLERIEYIQTRFKHHISLVGGLVMIALGLIILMF